MSGRLWNDVHFHIYAAWESSFTRVNAIFFFLTLCFVCLNSQHWFILVFWMVSEASQDCIFPLDDDKQQSYSCMLTPSPPGTCTSRDCQSSSGLSMSWTHVGSSRVWQLDRDVLTEVEPQQPNIKLYKEREKKNWRADRTKVVSGTVRNLCQQIWCEYSRNISTGQTVVHFFTFSKLPLLLSVCQSLLTSLKM